MFHLFHFIEYKIRLNSFNPNSIFQQTMLSRGCSICLSLQLVSHKNEDNCPNVLQRQVSISCLIFSLCHNDCQSLMHLLLGPALCPLVFEECCSLLEMAILLICSCPVLDCCILTYSLGCSSSSVLSSDGSLLQAVNSANASHTASGTLAQPTSLAQSKLLFSHFVLPSRISLNV